MRKKCKSQCREKRDPWGEGWSWEETTEGEKGPSTGVPSCGARRQSAPPAVPASPPEGAPRSGPARVAGPCSWGRRAGRHSGDWRRVQRWAAAGAWGLCGPGPAALPVHPPSPASRTESTPGPGRLRREAGLVEGGAPAQQLPPPSRRPQTFTKRRVRPHQSPLIIVGWAAGGGRGPGPAGPLGTGSAEGAEPGAAAAGGGRK